MAYLKDNTHEGQTNNSVFKTLASSNHCEEERAHHDYYATEPKAAALLMEVEEFSDNVWEPACGECHLSNELSKKYNVRNSDIFDRGCGNEILDFLEQDEIWDGDIVTNPPYSKGMDFVYKALDTVTDGHKVCMFLKVQFLEGKARKQLFEKYPPKTVYISSSRLVCAKNGDFKNTKGSAVAYAWYVWQKGYKEDTVVKWIN